LLFCSGCVSLWGCFFGFGFVFFLGFDGQGFVGFVWGVGGVGWVVGLGTPKEKGQKTRDQGLDKGALSRLIGLLQEVGDLPGLAGERKFGWGKKAKQQGKEGLGAFQPCVRQRVKKDGAKGGALPTGMRTVRGGKLKS